MAKFNEILNRIEKRADQYMEFKLLTGLVKNNYNQKFWKGKLLVNPKTWAEMGRTKMDVLLKHMPNEFVNQPLPPIFGSPELLVPKYNNWMFHYISYLVEICHEPS